MTYKVYLGSPDILGRYLSIFCVDERSERDRWVQHGDEWQRIEDDRVAQEPTLRIPEDMGRALLTALLRHYDGGEDTRSLRKDYDAERQRVDKMIDTLTTFVRGT